MEAKLCATLALLLLMSAVIEVSSNFEGKIHGHTVLVVAPEIARVQTQVWYIRSPFYSSSNLIPYSCYRYTVNLHSTNILL